MAKLLYTFGIIIFNMKKTLRGILTELSAISRTLDTIANIMLIKERRERAKLEKSSSFDKLSKETNV